MEDHEGVLIGVAAKEEGAGMAVKWVGDKPHRTSHSCYHHLRKSTSRLRSPPEKIIQRQSLIAAMCLEFIENH